MRKLVAIVCALCVAGCVWSQTFHDCNLFGTQTIMGTARFVGMAGAMTALGGDPSAVNNNPAGLGVFRHDEISISADWLHKGLTVGNGDKCVNSFPELSQVALVFAIHLNDKQKGMPYCNFMLGYQRLNNFRLNTLAKGPLTASQTNLMAFNTNGLVAGDFVSDPWANQDIGWLSIFGVNNHLISTPNASSTEWSSVVNSGEQVVSETSIVEAGSVDEYTFACGGNISNKVYIGLSVNLRTLSYSKSVSYSELFSNGKGYTMASTFSADGLGVNGNFGIIYRPIKLFRIGASFQTPSAMNTKFTNSVYCDDTYYDNGYSDNAYQMPMRSTFGFAFQIGNYGLISAEYDYVHQITRMFEDGAGLAMQDQHMLKCGMEWIAAKHCFFHAGYAFATTAANEDNMFHSPDAALYKFAPHYASTRTDTEYLLNKSNHFASVGVGYHGKTWIADVAYQCAVSKANFYPFIHDFNNLQTMNYNCITHRVVVTLAWQHKN